MHRPWTTSFLVGILAALLAACQTVPQGPPTLSAMPTRAPGALPPASTPMPQGLPARDPPPGFISFCMRFEDQCSALGTAPAVVQLDAQTWSELKAVNAGVNAAIWPEDDKRHFDRAEYWTIPTDGYGNCHDYALTKRKLLADAGLPLRALRIAVLITPRNDRHAVLTVATNRGDYVLDNLTDDIVAWDKTGYDWLTRQDANGGWGWVALDDAPMRLAATTAESKPSTN